MANKLALADHLLTTHERVRQILRVVPHRIGRGPCGHDVPELEAFVLYDERGHLCGLMDFRGAKAADLPLPCFGPAEPFWRILHRSAGRGAKGRCYFIGGNEGAIKIGFSVDIAGRLKAIQACSPIELRILAVVPGGADREAAYHEQFKAHRLHGEWFAPHPDILAEIDRINAEPTHDL